MAIVHYTEASGGLPNSGRLSGTDGDLVGIMDVVMPAAGWAIEYTGTNTRVYRPASGNRFRLHMNDAAAASGSAALCVVRGCENASNSTTLVDPFPTVAQVANGSSNWLKSSAVNTTARNFDIFAGPTWVIYCVNFSGATNVWECHFFGDFSPALSGDSYNTTCFVRNSTLISTAQWFSSAATSSSAGTNTFYITRSYDASTKSTHGGILQAFFGNLGILVNYPQAFSGPSTGLDTNKAAFLDSGSTGGAGSSSLGMPIRGYLPNVRCPIHNGRQAGTPNSRDTYTDTAYNASFVGTVFTGSNSASGAFFVVEGSDTWSPPLG